MNAPEPAFLRAVRTPTRGEPGTTPRADADAPAFDDVLAEGDKTTRPTEGDKASRPVEDAADSATADALFAAASAPDVPAATLLAPTPSLPDPVLVPAAAAPPDQFVDTAVAAPMPPPPAASTVAAAAASTVAAAAATPSLPVALPGGASDPGSGTDAGSPAPPAAGTDPQVASRPAPIAAARPTPSAASLPELPPSDAPPTEAAATDAGRTRGSTRPAADIGTAAAPPGDTAAPTLTPAQPVALTLARADAVPPAWTLAREPVQAEPRRPDAASNPAAVVGQVAVAIAGAEHKRVEIRLDPPELGRVQIHLTPTDAGGLQATVLADRPETGDFLRRHAAQLARELSEAGYGEVDLDFATGGDAARDEAPPPRPAWTAPLGGFEPAVTAATPLPVATPGATSGVGPLDIRL